MRRQRFLRKFKRSKRICWRTVYRDVEQDAYCRMAKEMAVRIGSNDKPVLVGPYLGDAGVELLYWIPFLRWLLKWGDIERSRVWIMSRDRVGDWYSDAGGHYIELNDLSDAQCLSSNGQLRLGEGRKRLPGRGHISRFDLEVIEKVMAERGFDDVELIHPSHMFQVLQPYTKGRSALSYIEGLARSPRWISKPIPFCDPRISGRPVAPDIVLHAGGRDRDRAAVQCPPRHRIASRTSARCGPTTRLR